jgi:prolyl-tRNA synthetase
MVLIKKAESFERWYRIIELADFAMDVDGWTVLLPNGLETWHLAMDRLNDLLLTVGYQNWSFPVTAAKAELLPAAEIILKAIRKRLKKKADLPLLIDNYINLQLRKKAGLPLLADMESAANESWGVFATQKEAEDGVKVLLTAYRELLSGICRLDYLELLRPWMGNGYIIGLDGQLPDGRVINIGTISYLDQHAARRARIKVDGAYPYIIRANISARLLGLLAAVHGDVRGLILPPVIAPLQVVIIPIFTGLTKTRVLEKSGEILGRLAAAGYRAHLDDRPIRAEQKVHEWELKGVPIRIEIGLAELTARQVTFVRRDFLERISISEARLENELIELADSISFQLRKRAMEALLVQDAASLKEARAKAAAGFVRMPLCMRLACGRRLAAAGLSARGTLFGKAEFPPSSCAVCGMRAKAWLYAART